MSTFDIEDHARKEMNVHAMPPDENDQHNYIRPSDISDRIQYYGQP